MSSPTARSARSADEYPRGAADRARFKLAGLNVAFSAQALIHCIAEGDHVAVQLLLEAGMDPNAQASGRPALVHAVSSRTVNRESIVRVLLDAGADPNVEVGDTSLIVLALRSEDFSIAKLLIDHGAEPKGLLIPVIVRLAGQQNPTAKSVADELLTALLENPVLRLELPEALVTAAGRYPIVIQRLLDAGADPNADVHGTTALTAAVQTRRLDAVRLLLDWKADPNRGGGYFGNFGNSDVRCTNLMIAVRNGSESIADALISGGANVNAATDKNNVTALMFAAALGSEPCVRLLLRRGANREAKNSSGKTAQMIAESRGYQKVADLLAEASMERESTSHWTNPLPTGASQTAEAPTEEAGPSAGESVWPRNERKNAPILSVVLELNVTHQRATLRDEVLRAQDAVRFPEQVLNIFPNPSERGLEWLGPQGDAWRFFSGVNGELHYSCGFESPASLRCDRDPEGVELRPGISVFRLLSTVTGLVQLGVEILQRKAGTGHLKVNLSGIAGMLLSFDESDARLYPTTDPWHERFWNHDGVPCAANRLSVERSLQLPVSDHEVATLCVQVFGEVAYYFNFRTERSLAHSPDRLRKLAYEIMAMRSSASQ